MKIKYVSNIMFVYPVRADTLNQLVIN